MNLKTRQLWSFSCNVWFVDIHLIMDGSGWPLSCFLMTHFVQIMSINFISSFQICFSFFLSLLEGVHYHIFLWCMESTLVFCLFIFYFIMILPLLTLHCYDITLWQAWCFLELLWTWFLNLLPCLSWKFGTHLFNLAVLLWNLQKFGLEVGNGLHAADATSKAYYVLWLLLIFS